MDRVGPEPLIVGREEDVAEPGMFFTHDASGQSILVSRDLGGRVHAMKNVCMHRGTRLVYQERGSALPAGSFTCLHHGWAYDLCGRLGVGISRCAEGEPRDERMLVALPSEVRHGFVWVVSSARGAIDVAGALGPHDAELTTLDLASYVVVARRTTVHAVSLAELVASREAKGARRLVPTSLVLVREGAVSHLALFPRGDLVVEETHTLLVAPARRQGASHAWERAEGELA